MKNDKVTPVIPPTLRSGHLSLRPAEEVDLRTLHGWRSDPGTLYLWSDNRHLIGYEAFVRELNDESNTVNHVLMVVEWQGEVIGMVFSHNAQFVDGWCFIATYLRPDKTGRGHGLKATTLFLNYLFTYFGFRKIYAEVVGYNRLSLESCRSLGFVQEGRFRRHRYFDGRWWDLYRLAIYRRSLPKIRQLANGEKNSD